MRENMKISGITLGTVQLGLAYGIANRQGRPDDATAMEILDAAGMAGITALDTAASYGRAEEVIGNYLREKGRDSFPCIVTKFRIPDEIDHSPAAIRDNMYASAQASVKALGIERIPVFLFHQGIGQHMERLADTISEAFRQLRSDGLIESGGLSVYQPSEVVPVMLHEDFRHVQVPLNILDHRLLSNGILSDMQANGKLVFARSIFLQGLFFLDPGELKGRLSEAAPYLHQLRELALAEDMSIAQLALSFVRDLGGVTSLVLGAEDPRQVLANADMLKGPGLRDETRRKAARLFANVPEHILNPALWTK
jgi:aryl-alcohol dehydrogenase-like predicted oxidoreductase